MPCAPKLIRYRGQRYVLAATPHERCTPDAQGNARHWNEIKKQCLPVDRKTYSAIVQAHALSGDANHASRNANPANIAGRTPEPAHLEHGRARAQRKHQAAATAYQQLATTLHGQGFHEYAEEHRQRAQRHSQHAAAHQRGEVVDP